jgi:tRNA pseudouridine55 synthase
VVLPAAEVWIHALELMDADLPDVRVRVSCSSGTYVRALARDWGRALGAGAHLRALRRTRVGPFDVSDALPPEALDARDRLLGRLLDPAGALAHLPSVSLGDADASRLAHGQEVQTPDAALPEGRPLAVLRGGALVAVATSVGGRLRPRKVFAGWRKP